MPSDNEAIGDRFREMLQPQRSQVSVAIVILRVKVLMRCGVPVMVAADNLDR